jgi:hypothetical protein
MKLLTVLTCLCLACPALADPTPKGSLSGVSFLVGQWQSANGKVSDPGETSTGKSVITVEADGNALLRRDRTDLFDKNGKPAGGFSQTMMIYAESGTVGATYVDGEGHVIHYPSSVVVPGKSVEFNGAPGPGPTFRLSYTLVSPDALAVSFGMVPPRGTFHQIAAGTLHRAH